MTAPSARGWPSLPALLDQGALHGAAGHLARTLLPARSMRLTRACDAGGQVAGFRAHRARQGCLALRADHAHVLRNALIPITTMAGMHFGGMLGGAVVVETVYSWPGLGRLAFEAVMARDFSVLLGILAPVLLPCDRRQRRRRPVAGVDRSPNWSKPMNSPKLGCSCRSGDRLCAAGKARGQPSPARCPKPAEPRWTHIHAPDVRAVGIGHRLARSCGGS